MVAKYAIIYDDSVTSPATDALLCYCDLNTGGTGISVASGNTLTITFAASGILKLTGAQGARRHTCRSQQEEEDQRLCHEVALRYFHPFAGTWIRARLSFVFIGSSGGCRKTLARVGGP